MALSWPVEAPVTQQFGSNPNSIQPNGHTGVDFGVPEGTAIYAADSGNIEFEGWATTLSASNPWWIAPAYAGILVIINHNDGFMSVYGHLSSTTVDNGQFVEKGQLIGYSGTTGLSTGPHLHFEIFGWPLQPYNGYYGRLNPNLYCGGFAKAPELAGNQRVVGQFGAKERTAATTASAEGRVFTHGDVLTFKGFVRGENVNGSDIWFVGGFSGTFFHSSAFDDSGTHDLQDLTPAPAPVVIGAQQRKVGAATIRYRKEANTSADIIEEFEAGAVLNFSAFKHGQKIDGNDIWFKGALSGGYAWSGGFEDQSTSGLPEEATSVPSPAPVPTPAPAPEKYSFTKDFDFVEYIPAAIGKFQYGNFPSKPEKVVIHQFGTVGIDTIGSTINTFTNPTAREASAHFIVSGKRIVQMVSLKDRAYHAGRIGNNWVGIETDPAQDAETIASTKKLLAALKEKYGYELVKTLHKDVPEASTNCGASITLSKYDLDTPIIVVPVTPTEPTPTDIPETPVVVTPAPTPNPTPESVDAEAIIDDFLNFLKEEYFQKK
jgi:hypothetical protein